MNMVQLLIKTGETLYGERWQTNIARDFGFKEGRRIRQWVSKERPMPADAADILYKLLEDRQKAISNMMKEIKPHTTK